MMLSVCSCVLYHVFRGSAAVLVDEFPSKGRDFTLLSWCFISGRCVGRGRRACATRAGEGRRGEMGVCVIARLPLYVWCRGVNGVVWSNKDSVEILSRFL